MAVREEISYNPFEYNKRETLNVKNIGGYNFPVVISDLSNKKNINLTEIRNAGYVYNKKTNTCKISQLAADYIYIGNNKIKTEFTDNLNLICDYTEWQKLYYNKSNIYPLFSIDEYLSAKIKSDTLNFVKINLHEINCIKDIKKSSKIVLVLDIENNDKINEQREFFNILLINKINTPVVLYKKYNENEIEKFQLFSSGDIGSLLIDGLGNGVWLYNHEKISSKEVKCTSFGILQACGLRISKTEYISCPSCGRTLFDIQNTVEQIRKRTKHFVGIKIAIMGCIVNGLGEMADADYGYVGGIKGKVNLYMNKKLVKQNIPEEKAVDELLKLIKKTRN